MIQLCTQSIILFVPQAHYNKLCSLCSFRGKRERAQPHTLPGDLRGALRTMGGYKDEVWRLSDAVGVFAHSGRRWRLCTNLHIQPECELPWLTEGCPCCEEVNKQPFFLCLFSLDRIDVCILHSAFIHPQRKIPLKGEMQTGTYWSLTEVIKACSPPLANPVGLLIHSSKTSDMQLTL